jgi:hypothetical protein
MAHLFGMLLFEVCAITKKFPPSFTAQAAVRDSTRDLFARNIVFRRQNFAHYAYFKNGFRNFCEDQK